MSGSSDSSCPNYISRECNCENIKAENIIADSLDVKDFNADHLVTNDLRSETVVTVDIKVENHIDADSGTFDTLIANHASFDTLIANHASFESISVNNLNHNSVTIHGPTGYNVSNIDHIIYVDSTNGKIDLVLPAKFSGNQELIIKDISLAYGSGAAYNTYISCLSPAKIEHYIVSDKCHLLKCSSDGKYILNTSGGSVIYRYLQTDKVSAWTIQSQMIGNGRSRCVSY